MAVTIRKKNFKRIAAIIGLIFIGFFITLVILAEFYVEPALRKRLQALIIDGSDSLYTYQLGSLKASFLGGRVEVNNLKIEVDSTHYKALEAAHQLPSLVMNLDIKRASITGINVFALLFSKKIFIDEISSKEADVNLYRFPKIKDTVVVTEKIPLWKAIGTKIKDLQVNTIKLDGIKFLYKNEQGSEAAKLQFDRCDALFKNIRIDSAAVMDTSRIGYVENFSFLLNGLKFRTADSTYKMKAEWISYSSLERVLQIDSFKIQPTLKKDERTDSLQKSWYTATFDKVQFNGLRLDRYLRLNRAEADSVVFQNPKLSVYQDKNGMKSYKSKIGEYPHQKLLQANAVIDIGKFIAHNMQIESIEKQTTGIEGQVSLSELEVTVANIVNDPALIKKNPVATAKASGKIIGSPIQAAFRFYLDSANGRFDVQGGLQNVSAAQINPVSSSLANVEVPSVHINDMSFFIRGEDFGATTDVQMHYNNLSLIIKKRDEETGANTTRKFLTNLLNKFAMYPENPSNGVERKAIGIKTSRLTTQAFFGVIWQAAFAGMENIMLKSGSL